METICTQQLFDLNHTIAAPLFGEEAAPYSVLSGLSDKIVEIGQSLNPALFDMPQENV